MSVTRRGLLVGSASVAALSLLAACRDDSTKQPLHDEEHKDCDLDDLIEGDSDCSLKPQPKSKPKTTTKPKVKSGG